MKIIIVGCGRVGQTLAEKLCDDGNEITVVDLSPEKVRNITDNVDVMGVKGYFDWVKPEETKEQNLQIESAESAEIK